MFLGENNRKAVAVNQKGNFVLLWPTGNDEPVSELATQYFFTLPFLILFPYATGIFY